MKIKLRYNVEKGGDNMNIDETLSERQKTHGDFENHAEISTALKSICHTSRNWNDLPPVYKEGLDMIMHKVARIVSGNPLHRDHVIDIQGYAKLMEKYCE